MKTFITLAFLLLSSFLQAQSNLPAWGQDRFKKFADKYTLSNYIKPQFLQADFSGDRTADLAILVERRIDKKKGMIILFQESDKSFEIGAGNKLSDAGDNFDWANTWNIFKDGVTYETTFKDNGDIAGGREIKIDRPAIEIWEQEGSGGLIYFDGKKFNWIHQGD